ncbi:uncharacterized protein LOC143214194 [Lasioglossum baleicum]|uniref:uncharacterized protein LOC143214194 n=1 Tax=Lasioglossum baleicum TaxID=434251 RepID=UPI003FCCEBF6
MKQFFNKPTRTTKDSQTTIDLVFANNEIAVDVRDNPKITDHAVLEIKMSHNRSDNSYRLVNGRDYSKFHMCNFHKELERNVIQGQGLTVNARAVKLINEIVDTLDKAAPKRTFRIPNIWYGKKWFSNEITVAASERDNAFRIAVSTEDIDFEIDNSIMNKCNIADKFNIFYIESLNKIVNSIEGGKSKSPEKRISSELLKSVFHVIKDEFLGVINESLRTGQCPDGWKTSTIIPIPKVNKPKKASEYRPINMLPIYEKVLELVVKEQIEMYLERNDIITEYQAGFRKEHSCETALQMLLDDWKLEVSEGKMVGVIFLDLKRAFETVNRERLIGKLEQYGIGGTVLKWFKSYLCNRRQQVRCGDIMSNLMENVYGVPQGSVLGPLLFIIYINDIVNICREGSIRLFADDTIIYITGESCQEIERKMNRMFNIAEEWMNINGSPTRPVEGDKVRHLGRTHQTTVRRYFDDQCVTDIEEPRKPGLDAISGCAPVLPALRVEIPSAPLQTPAEEIGQPPGLRKNAVNNTAILKHHATRHVPKSRPNGQRQGNGRRRTRRRRKKMDRMRKWACTTDGKDPFRFLERIGELAQSYHISDAELLEGVPELLRGDAQDWYRNNRYQISTWEEFTADFLMVYAGNKTPVQREREARARVQKPGEPFSMST